MDDRSPQIEGCDLLPAGLEARPYQQRIISRTVSLFRGTAVDREGRPEGEVSSVPGTIRFLMSPARWNGDENRHGKV